MDQRINRLEEKLDTKLDAIVNKLHEVNITLIRNTDSLELHERRTDIAEKNLKSYELRLEQVFAYQKNVNLIAFKIIPAIAGIITFAYKMGWLTKLFA